MTEDENIKRNLKYLDDILAHLVNNCSDYSVTFSDLYRWKFNRDFKTDNNEFKFGMSRTVGENADVFDFSVSDNTKAQGEKFCMALLFLNSKKLIGMDNDWNIKITFEGILEHGKGGFVKKLKTEKYKSFLDSFNVYVTILVAIISLVVGSLINQC